MEKIAKNIRALREHAGISYTDISEKLGRSLPTIRRWEEGTAEPSAKDIIALSILFGVTTDFLLKGDAGEILERQRKITDKAIKQESERFTGAGGK